MGKVLVTGANGHIGCNVVRALAGEREPVAFVRPSSDRRGLEGLSIEIREGDVLDHASLTRAMAGVEAVIHCAAAHRNFAADPSEILRPAVDGTKNVLDACASAGVERVVLTSTAATVGFAASATEPIDETHHVASPRSPYVRAKVEQERLALAERRVGVVVLNPSGVFGPHDYRLTPATRAFIGMLAGDPAMLGVSITDVRDVATAHVRALAKGRPGERYLVTGDVLTPAQASEAFARVAGWGPKVMTPPRWLVGMLAWWQERKARASGTDAPITREMLGDVWGKHLAYDSSRSRRELGMTYRSADEVIRDTIEWLLTRDAFPPKIAARLRSRAAPSRAA